jgi:hypothetical protein
LQEAGPSGLTALKPPRFAWRLRPLAASPSINWRYRLANTRQRNMLALDELRELKAQEVTEIRWA